MSEATGGAGERTLDSRLLAAVDRHLPVLLLAPAIVLVVATVAYPLAWVLWTSLSRVSILDPTGGTFVGLANYRTLLADPTLTTVLGNTVVFVVASVLGQFGLGLALSTLLDRPWLPGRLAGVFRAAFLLPWAVAGVVVAYSWRFVYEPRVGLLNAALAWVGVADPPAWLASVGWAMAAVVVANVWQGTPFSLVFMTSARRSVPRQLFEAASVGGATRWRTFRHVTWPLLVPFAAMNLLLITVFTVNTFDLIYVLTGGGPLDATLVLSVHTYDVAFERGRFGIGAALAVVLLVVNLVSLAGYLFLSEVTGR